MNTPQQPLPLERELSQIVVERATAKRTEWCNCPPKDSDYPLVVRGSVDFACVEAVRDKHVRAQSYRDSVPTISIKAHAKPPSSFHNA
jgi:hypothetical protein